MHLVKILITAIAIPASAANAAIFATSYSNYTAGSLTPANYNNPATALGKSNPVSGLYALSPYNGAFLNTDMVGIGAGGSLTLQFASTVPIGAGREFGVHAGVNLLGDGDGTSSDPAATFNVRRAIVEVSEFGIEGSFIALNSGNPITFDLPTNYWADLAGPPGTQTTGGTIVADFGKPFEGTLSSFTGLDWTAAKTLLNGSAGGTWFDVSGLGLTSLNYVRFSVPVGANYRMFIDSVAAVPEPATVALCALSALVLFRRR